MSKIKQNLVFLIEKSGPDSFDISWKAATMCLNRFCIDEDAAFELSGVHYLKDYTKQGLKKKIDPTFQKTFGDKTEDSEIHIVCAVVPYRIILNGPLLVRPTYSNVAFRRTAPVDLWDAVHNESKEKQLRSFILKSMKNYNVKSVMVSIFSMGRRHLITKEKMESFCKGKEVQKESVNDDLEICFEHIRLGLQEYSSSDTYFLPKLTEEELLLVETRDENYMKSFHYCDADVEKAEMKLSKSDSKFVRGLCYRRTFTIENKTLLHFSSCCPIQ